VGSANVTSVTVTCVTNAFTIGGTLAGLSAGNSIVLRNNNTDSLTLSSNGAFTFPTTLPSGSAYAVTVFTAPAGQTCIVANGSGTVSGASVTNVTVHCGGRYDFTGSVQTFTVPPGVTSITVTAYGAQGGAGDLAGGLGGRATATIPVTPGEVLNVYVGGAGRTITTTQSSTGGYNGGGGVMDCCGQGPSGTGGGASDVRRGTALSNRLIVAGGGGGGGWASNGGTGGAGGGLTGGAGGSTSATRNGGGGGTQSAGGAAGWVGTNYPNQPGSFGIGGTGWRDGAGTGAGGGGWYGGGAGGFTGGGGGSSYVAAPGNTNTSTSSGVRSGDGQVVIGF
jgi:hypothetical protein